jgi:hypothetical protein
MPDITQIQPAQYAGPQDRLAESQAVDAGYKGVQGTLEAALDTGPTADFGHWLARKLEEAPDHNWHLTTDSLEHYGEGISRDLWPMFAEAQSHDDAMRVRGVLLNQMDNRRALLGAGKFGTVSGFAANVFDPTFMLAGAMTGGAATATKVGMLARMAEGGLVTGTTFGGLELARQSVAPTEQSGRSELGSTVGGFALGAMGPVTAPMRMLPRIFVTGGVAGAASLLSDKAYATATGTPLSSGDIWGNAAQQFALMGVLSGFHARTPEDVATARAMHEAGVDAVKDGMYRTALQSGSTTPLSPRDAIASEIRTNPEAFVFHGTGADQAQSMELSGFHEGGLTWDLNEALQYADSLEGKGDGVVVVFRKSDLPPDVANKLVGGRADALKQASDYERISQEGDYSPNEFVGISSKPKPTEVFSAAEIRKILSEPPKAGLTPQGKEFFDRQINIQPRLDEHGAVLADQVADDVAALETGTSVPISEPVQGLGGVKAANERLVAQSFPEIKGANEALTTADDIASKIAALEEKHATAESAMADPEIKALEDRYSALTSVAGQAIEDHAASELSKQTGIDRDILASVLREHYGAGWVAFSHFGQKKMGEAFNGGAGESTTLASVASDLLRGDMTARGLDYEGVLNPHISGLTEAGIAAEKQRYADMAVKVHEYVRGIASGQINVPIAAPASAPSAQPIQAMGAASPSTIEKPRVARKPKTEEGFDFSKVEPAPSDMIRVGQIGIRGWRLENAPVVGDLLKQPLPLLKSGIAGIPIDIRLGARLFRSPDSSLNLLARVFNGDRLVAADGSPAVFGARQKVKELNTKKNAAMNFELTKLYGEHMTAAKTAGAKPMDFADWSSEVGKAVLHEPGRYGQDVSVSKAADVMRQVFKWGRDFAESHEVPDFDRFASDPTWMPRIGDRPAIDAYVKAYGQNNDLLTRISEAIAKGDMMERKAEVGGKDGTLLPVRRFDDAATKEMADAWIRNANKGGQDINDRTSRRIPMDATHSWQTPDGKTWNAYDLMVTDAPALGEMYNRQVIGASAAQAGFQRLSDFMRPAGEAKGPQITTREELLKTLQDNYDLLRQQGIDNPSVPAPTQFKKDMIIADALVRLTEGTPIRENTDLARAARIIQNVNILGDMANVTTGVMNTSQLAGSMAQVGMQAATRQFGLPFTDLIGIIRSGKADSVLARDVQAMGLGVEAVAHPVRRSLRVDEDSFGQIQNKAEYLAAKGARMSLTASGHIATIDWMRTAVGRVAQQVWLDAALSGKGMIAELGKDRVAALGISPSDSVIGRIEQHMRDHAATENGMMGVKLNNPNTELWSLPDGTHDLEAVAAYREAISLATTRAVLIPDTTDLPLWMSHPLAGLFAQFRKFALTNVRDRFAFNASMGDKAALSSMLLDTAGAAVAYSVVVYLRSLGRTDAQDYRDKMLAPDMVAKAAFARSSWMNMIPALVDTTAHDVLGRSAIFEHARTTGLQGGLGSGNPTFDRLNHTIRSFGSVQSLFMDDYQFSKEDLDHLQKGWMIPNFYGVQQGFQRVRDNLPDHSIEK